ncbi:MAG TPA: tetratricopeptide repeat protein, partial [Micropepsaceae bacterium]|nr:tetratricopeptide repeat protein [Micropepsaceae bacterium]
MSEALLQSARRAHALGNLPEAARIYAEILRGNSKNFDALYALGIVHFDRGGFDEARRVLAEAIKLNPRSAEALFAHGCALQRLNRHGQALAAFDQALALDADYDLAVFRRADTLRLLGGMRDAVEGYDRYLARNPDSAEAWHNRGLALSELKRFEDAVSSFGKALALRPDSAESWHNQGTAHVELKNYQQAVFDYERAVARKPDLPYARGNLLLARLQCCDWRDFAQERSDIAAALLADAPAIVPFGNLMISHSPADQFHCARIWMERHSVAAGALWRGERYNHPRVRVAYLSGDFRVHPVAILMAGVFEQHDRERFETIAVSFGADDQSEIRTRVKDAVETFIDARGKSDFEIASLLRQREVDIAVDLMGLTADCRSRIFAFRPAPVQVNYLGYPGTMATESMDYIIADRVVVPEDEKHQYREKMVYLPDSYLASDDKRRIAARRLSRAEAGLPNEGFVFCSFNHTYKFTPEMFALWMRLLRKVEGSMLWLPENNESALRNLKREAEAAGIDAGRLVFAPHLASLEEHLARLSLADLFLDTLPCNAHSTASDALWAGLPVLTCMGSTFAGRVAASLLHALGLPELVVQSLADYEAKALSLATDAAALADLKTKLARQREIAPLFDTVRFTRNLESAFATMRNGTARGE